MPVTTSHAFGRGPVFGGGPLSARAAGLFHRWMQGWSNRFSALAALDSFYRGAVLNGPLWAGPHAFCHNPGQKEDVRIGAHVICRGIIRCETWSPGKMRIGDHVYVGDDCILSCAERIDIGDNCLLAHGVQIFDNNTHPLRAEERERDYRVLRRWETGPKPAVPTAPVILEDGVWLGFNVIVLKGVRIGRYSVIGAGSVVTKDVPANALAAGNPARVLRSLA